MYLKPKFGGKRKRIGLRRSQTATRSLETMPQPQRWPKCLYYILPNTNYRETSRQRPGTMPRFTTHIAATKEESIEKDRETFPNGRTIYTDGSGFKGAIGAAAVVFVNGTKTAELRYQLGPDTKHTSRLRRRTCGHHTGAPPRTQRYRYPRTHQCHKTCFCLMVWLTL